MSKTDKVAKFSCSGQTPTFYFIILHYNCKYGQNKEVVVVFWIYFPIVIQITIPQCWCPNHPGRQETSLSVPAKRNRYPKGKITENMLIWRNSIQHSPIQTKEHSDLLAGACPIHGGVLVVAQDLPQAEPIQEELHCEDSPWVSWKRLSRAHTHIY